MLREPPRSNIRNGLETVHLLSKLTNIGQEERLCIVPALQNETVRVRNGSYLPGAVDICVRECREVTLGNPNRIQRRESVC